MHYSSVILWAGKIFKLCLRIYPYVNSYLLHWLDTIWQRWKTLELSLTMRLEMKPLISHLNPAQCSAHARLSSYGAMIEILNIEDLELNVSLQCRRECVWWGAWKFHLDQCSVMAACPRYRWQHINTSNPGHRVTHTRAPKPDAIPSI